jgi:hypothetical protein
MATSTLLQYLETTDAVTGASLGASPSNRRQVETFIAGATVVVGDWLQFDTSKTGAAKVLTVIQAAANGTGNPLVVGVCLGSADSDGSLTVGSKINVAVAGYVESANVANAVAAAGVALTVDAAGAGQAVAITAADTGPACGVTLSAPVANKAEVWVYKQF